MGEVWYEEIKNTMEIGEITVLEHGLETEGKG
jgi:hypothetical protein